MKYSEALKAIADSGLENAAEVVDAIKDRLTASSQAETRANEMDALLESLFGALSVEGSDLAGKLDKAQSTIKGLRDERADFEQKFLGSQSEIEKLKREGVIDAAAQALGANGAVLRVLLSGQTEPLEMKDGKPMMGSKELKGWIEEERKDFLPSLFPQPQSKGSLPTGSSAGNPPKEEKPNPMGSFQQGYVKALEKSMGVS